MYISVVQEFHELTGCPILDTPTNTDRAKMRVNLIQEELNELQEAIENNNLVEILDALGDIQYVVSGAVLEFGMQDIFKLAFLEIHASNMSKASISIEDAEKTAKLYKDKHGWDSIIVPKDGKYIVCRTDGKILKSINYTPANLKQFL